MQRYLLFTGLFLSALITFQNCGQFESMDGSSLGLSLQDQLVQEQSKALVILANNCASCHGTIPSGGVANITNVDHLIESGLIVPGRPEDSPLISSVESNLMPPSNPLQTGDKITLENWVLLLGGVEPSTQTDLSDLSFEMKISIDPLPYRVRLAKLVQLVGTPDSTSLMDLMSDNIAQGDFDFSRGILPKFTWETRDMQMWLEAMDPVCGSADLTSRFQFPNTLDDFILESLGRPMNATEDEIVATLASRSGLTNGDRFRLFCLSTLGSMEYITK